MIKDIKLRILSFFSDVELLKWSAPTREWHLMQQCEIWRREIGSPKFRFLGDLRWAQGDIGYAMAQMSVHRFKPNDLGKIDSTIQDLFFKGYDDLNRPYLAVKVRKKEGGDPFFLTLWLRCFHPDVWCVPPPIEKDFWEGAKNSIDFADHKVVIRLARILLGRDSVVECAE